MTEEELKKQFKDIVATDRFGRRHSLSSDEAYDLLYNKGYGVRRSCWPSFQFIFQPAKISLELNPNIYQNDPAMRFLSTLIERETPIDLGIVQYRLFLNGQNELESVIMCGWCSTHEDDIATDWEEFFIPDREPNSITSKNS